MVSSGNDLSEDVYVQFVRSLFGGAHILLIGGVCNLIVAASIFFKTGITAFLACGFILLAVNIWRYAGIRDFHRAGGVLKDAKDAERWEWHYVVRGSVQGLCLGSFAFISIFVYADPFAELCSVAITSASLVTVVSRNYGSPKMVKILSTTFIGPPALALMLSMNPYQFVLGLMTVPLAFVSIQSARGLRQVLFSAVIGHKTADQLARRFDRALNTMPQGLVMFNSEGRVIVANHEAVVMLGMNSADTLVGRSLRSLVMRLVASGKLDKTQGDQTNILLSGAIRKGFGSKMIIALTDGRYFELSTREGDQNIGVILFEDVTTRVRDQERISAMARFDSLTGLPNRAYLNELVVGMLKRGDPDRHCALAVVDLDDFKGVNDTLGHPVGDGLIYAIAERLSRFVDENIVAGRFGGDEFMIYIDHVEDPSHLSAILTPILVSIGEEVDVAGHSLNVQASAGAVCSPVRDANIDAMTVRADLALYSAKEDGKGTWRLFEGNMDEEFRSRQSLKADLRSAVESRALRVVYQPIVSLQTMRTVGCEALCRWDHPEHGPISPAVFVPLAEEMGIISRITTFVLEAACMACAEWPAPISVSVNLSAKDLTDDGVVDKVRRALELSGLHPSRLELEVTETALLDDKVKAILRMEQLHGLGVRITLDDFGTGYSSLSYLHRLPFDKVKIDRSFLVDMSQDARSLALLAGIVSLSRELGMSVTIEGVETFQQLRVLTSEVKPDLAQGFLFGAPLSASGIEAMAATVWPSPLEAPTQVRIAARH